MFAHAHRLDRATFARTYKHGRRVHTPGFVLVYEAAPAYASAAVVGKKVAKSAVVRNLLKRRLYAALYETTLPVGHIIILAKPSAETYSYARLHAEVTAALSKAVGQNAHSR